MLPTVREPEADIFSLRVHSVFQGGRDLADFLGLSAPQDHHFVLRNHDNQVVHVDQRDACAIRMEQEDACVPHLIAFRQHLRSTGSVRLLDEKGDLMH